MKYHIHIKANTDELVKEELKESAHLLTGFYEAVKDFDENFGHERAKSKREWKERVSKWIDKNKIKAP